MQKKISIFLFMMLLSCSAVVAQSSRNAVQEGIDRGVSLYNFGHWIEARTELRNIRAELSPVTDRIHIERIDYYLALCDAELKLHDAEGRLKRFLAEYSSSPHVNDIQFALASMYCAEGNDELAAAELDRVNYDRLNPSQQDKFNLRMGYMTFQKGDYPEAERYFSRIGEGGEYSDHAVYYKSYMAYARGEIDVARNGFNSLMSSAMYRDLMPYYLLQLDFKEGNYQSVVSKGDALLQQTTQEHAQQIRRMMAESWFQLGDYASAVKYITAYKVAEGEMGRVENYIMGYSLYRQTRYSEATPYLREVCGADDLLTQNASYHLADCYLHAGDKSNAMHSFAMSANAGFDAAIAEDALFNYGKLQYELGGGVFNEAINVLNRYISTYPTSLRKDEARKLLIAAYYNSHNYAEAYQAIKSMPNPDGEVQLALQKIAYFNGLEAYSAGELARAETSLFESMGVGNNAKYSALASFWLGEIAYSKGDSSSALQRYRNFIARAPRNGQEYAMAHYNMGYCYFNNGDLVAAGEAFDKFLSLRSTRDSYRADALNRRGDVHYGRREFAAAVACYDKAIAQNGAERYYAEFQRAKTYGIQNKRTEKINALQRIVQANRGDYVDAATYELGHTYIADEKYAQGVKILEEFIGQYPNSQYNAQALSDLGLAYMNLGEEQKALSYYDRVVKAAPQSSQSKSALEGIKDIYMARGNADDYFNYAQSLGLEGNVSAMTRDSLSYAAAQKLYLDNKTKEAAISFSGYLNNYPKGYYRSDALFYLSDCHIRNGNDDEAMKSLSELSAQGHTQYSERVLERLSSMCYKREMWAEAAKAYRQLYDEASTQAIKATAASGYVASTLKYADDAGLVAMADDAEKMPELSDVARRKARYAKATVLLRSDNEGEAMAIFKLLSAEVKSAEGAEARYRMIEAEYKANNFDKAEKMIYEFSDSKTPQNYWLAKSFILLGDIYLSRKDEFQARATYQSVVDGYSPADDGIVDEAKAKIAKMN